MNIRHDSTPVDEAPIDEAPIDEAPVEATPAAALAFGALVRRSTLPVTLLMQSAASAAVLAPAVAAPYLLLRLQLPAAAVGIFIAVVYLAAMFSSPLGARAVRRFGPIRSSQLGLLVSAIGLASVAVPSVWAGVLGALMIGLGYGPITPASSQMLSRTTDLRHYSLVFSIKQTGVPLGGVIGGLMIPPLLDVGGATAAMLGMGALCVVAALSAIPLRAPLDADRDVEAEWFHPRAIFAPVKFVLTHAVLRRIAICATVLSSVQVCFTSYLVTFVTQDWQWTLVAAGVAMSAAQTSGVVGRITWGIVSDRWLGPRLTLAALTAAMAACTLALAFMDGTRSIVAVIVLCLFGATAVGWNGVFLATVARIAPDEAAAATAGTLMFAFLGVVIGPPILGAIGQAFGELGPAFGLLTVPLLAIVWLLRRGSWG